MVAGLSHLHDSAHNLHHRHGHDRSAATASCFVETKCTAHMLQNALQYTLQMLE
jgi:hypothetical protein